MQNRLSGLVVFLFGLLTFFVLIPMQTEAVDYGWLRPATLPSIAAVIIGLSGLVQCVFPTGAADFNLVDGLRVLLYLCIGIAGLWGMHAFGFVVTAPLLMLCTMLIIGERRWLWLCIGCVLLPAFIWFCIEFLLQRPLP